MMSVAAALYSTSYASGRPKVNIHLGGAQYHTARAYQPFYPGSMVTDVTGYRHHQPG